MGRKVSRQSSCLKEAAKKEKKQLDHLIRVLRPKVYITEISNFKKLVQQLTGNGSLPLDQQTRPKMVERSTAPPEVVHVEGHDYQGGDIEPQSNNCSGQASSFEASVDSFDQLCNNVNTSSSLVGLLEAKNNQVQLLDETSWSTIFDVPSMNQHYWDWLAYQEIEAWLLDHDHDHDHHQAFPILNGFVQNHQEVSVYDYEPLSWANHMN